MCEEVAFRPKKGKEDAILAHKADGGCGSVDHITSTEGHSGISIVISRNLANNTKPSDDDDVYYYSHDYLSNASLGMFAFVDLSNSTQNPYFSCRDDNSTSSTYYSIQTIEFTYSVEYETSSLKQEYMVAAVENEMTNAVANYLLNCGSNSNISLTTARSSQFSATNYIAVNEASSSTESILAVYAMPTDYLAGPCVNELNTNTSFCTLKGAMSFNARNTTTDDILYSERIAIIRAISDMESTFPRNGFRSIQYIGPALREPINTNRNSIIAIVLIFGLTLVFGVSMIFFFSKIFVPDSQKHPGRRGAAARMAKSSNKRRVSSEDTEDIKEFSDTIQQNPIDIVLDDEQLTHHQGGEFIRCSPVKEDLSVIMEEDSDLASSA
eukprot:CAMPEP_0172430772 /NCGR_PEP_ID=MMETSP1064-20121228/56003_1 /TAXON_ID=202472 /ORGANISM="Aulacoseira subarctica , Strain CCAP 1002/5" /LENGTH=381 /DNA_ID=CAMNT_0013177091 /DNA_START=136 /DNA_END=1278 /DNA_ORIENTATION=-